MEIKDIEYIAPTRANPIGSVKFTIEVPILYKEGETKEVVDNDNAEVMLSQESQEVARKLAEIIIKDITE